ncbi:RNA polymerase sigma factor, partial [Butyricicoccus sp.]|uniref:RNA polymerase sigma factor n=1 Tax=Butyricicoccus sp. TaxID=2049021 RepID=UPI003F18A020
MGIKEEEKHIIQQLYLEMYDLLMSYAYGVLGNYALAEEAVQETFRIACTKPEALLESQNQIGWLINTLKHVLQNTKRVHSRLGQLQEKLSQLYPWKNDGKTDELDIDLLYSDLTEDPDFQLLKMVALDRKSVPEIAEELGISRDACAKRIQRARKQLKK